MSNLRQYTPDPDHIIPYESLQLKENLIEELVRIIDRMDRVMRNRTIAYAKVLSRHHKSTDATWEPEHIVQQKYPELFSGNEISRTKFLKRGENVRALTC